MSLRTSLGRVRGLGAAKEGVGHWWAQRLSALALIPLVLWFSASVVGLAGADIDSFRAWAGAPVNAGLLILLISFTFYHATLGVQVVIEDYVHTKGLKIAGLLIVQGLAIVLGLSAVLSVLQILFQG